MRKNKGWFIKGPDPRRHEGRKRGSRNRAKVERPYKCPHCYKPIGRISELRKRTGYDEAVRRWRQGLRLEKHRGQPRKGRFRFERGVKDPARNLAGRPLG